ncbi:hypothetical protein L873DRAFT_1085823 [Choiromyces venosus 120613-1]|uniref:Uncharacterized protein n=1 Tax=Choiromyces venosus 120613-1 TaxID=1336337 RepID=A0A3N4JVJ0_9PEZI|nr:hypothetical protein L873DRAFT_1085823 [Choiromyces venosus 120613-1]
MDLENSPVALEGARWGSLIDAIHAKPQVFFCKDLQLYCTLVGGLTWWVYSTFIGLSVRRAVPTWVMKNWKKCITLVSLEVCMASAEVVFFLIFLIFSVPCPPKYSIICNLSFGLPRHVSRSLPLLFVFFLLFSQLRRCAALLSKLCYLLVTWLVCVRLFSRVCLEHIKCHSCRSKRWVKIFFSIHPPYQEN